MLPAVQPLDGGAYFQSVLPNIEQLLA